jgi:hypothetical protein
MSTFVKYVLLAEGFAVATFALGWWTVPVVSVLWTIFTKGRYAPRNVGFAAAGGWASLLVLDVVRGPVATMGDQLARVMGLPAWLLYVITLLFPGLLAWSAATIVRRSRATLPEAAPSTASS